MTKVGAIKKVLEDNDGIAVWGTIYHQIEKYYPTIKNQIDWKAGVRGVLYRDIGKKFKMAEGAIALIDYDENKYTLKEFQNETSKSIQTKIRIGQDKFRKNLLKELKFCPITGIDNKQILIASHIKPWIVSNDEERLNTNNGFIFSPTIDKLFDSGLITFNNDKTIKISPLLNQKNANIIGIKNGKTYDELPIINRTNFLNYHRKYIFES